MLYKVYVDDAANGIAIGRIVKNDLTTEPTYIAKRDGLFAHGKSAEEAISAAMAKVLGNMPVEERVNKFIEKFPMVDVFVSGRELFDWHHILTGSCLQGRELFCKERGLDINGEYTILEFINLTENAYGGEVIRRLRETYIALQQQGGGRKRKRR